MEDSPPPLAEFEDRFTTEDACRAYLVQMRWPTGFRCPRCTAIGGWATKRAFMMCSQCGHQASVTAGTIFHRSHLPLRTWFRAMWWLPNQKHGVPALGLQRLLGLGSYRTAWACLQKLRRAMVRTGRDSLAGHVEVDETYIGGVEAGGGRRRVGDNAMEVHAAQVDGEGIGRLRLRRIPDASARRPTGLVKSAVQPGC